MWRKYRFTQLVWAGIAAGIILGLILNMVEHFTSYKVYTLLLNVDYVPVLKELQLSDLTEFMLHLLISVLLSMALTLFLQQKAWSRKRSMSFVILVCLAVGLLLFPTTALSVRTPALSDLAALAFWLTGHLAYGLALGWMLTGARRG